MDLNDIVNNMISDVKQGKHKKKVGKKKTSSSTSKRAPQANTPGIPWTDEALVLIATTHTCKSCGNEVTAWSPYIYIQRSRTISKKVSTLIERLPHCDPDITYQHLPRRIEHRHHTTCRCHLCFGDLPNGFKQDSVQLRLPFSTQPEQ